MQENIWSDRNLVKVLQENGVAVMPTDTIYGIVGRALNEEVVNRIYAARGRNPEKPCIVLIGDIKELAGFSILLSEKQKEILEEYWPGPVSIVLPCPKDELSYLHRGTKTLAFRLPASPSLRELLLKTGPLLAPSANKEGFPTSESIQEAKKYFGDSVDLYVNGGEIKGKASKLIKLDSDSSVVVLRD